MTPLRIVADDLTGALDTAAPLVPLAGPIPVFWDASSAERAGGTFALDIESRDVCPEPAPSWAGLFAGAGLAYKKVDSLLRGRTAEEVAACLASGTFSSAVIAPAFPAQQRITRAGRQYWRKTADEPWQAVACELATELRNRGTAPVLTRSADQLHGRGYFLCDAESEADLAAIADAGGASSDRPPPPAPPLLMLIGSHHPVTCAQVEALRGYDAAVVVDLDPGTGEELAPALEGVAAALAERRCAALPFALPDGTGREVAAPAYRRLFERAARDLAPPRSLFVTGGATLHQLARVLGARALRVTGELAPGIPCSILEGGAWPGVQVVSKSGAFGAPDLLIRLAESAMA